MKHTRWLVLGLALLVLCASSAWAQGRRRVQGRVTAAVSGEPVPSASVRVVGTTYGAITDENGHFSVSAPEGPVSLLVRRIGYTPKTIPVGTAVADIEVTLAKDVLELDKQVITGTATTVSSINVANAVAVVSSSQLSRVPSATIDNALQSKIAGAVISANSGAPGGGMQVQLRGISTLNASYQPLYVVDGVMVNNDAIQNGMNVLTQASRGSGVANFSSSQDQTVSRIADINPNDIESIQVLKGPSASSIYGSKGTNGVIIITTKQGRAGRQTIDLTQRVGQFSLSNKLGPFLCFHSAAEADDFGALGGGLDGQLWTSAKVKCHDYEQEFYGSNSDKSYQTTLSMRGSTAGGTNYFVSGLVQHDNGLALNDFYNKQSLRVNLGQQVGSRLTLKANTEIIHSLTQRGIFGNDNTGINPYTTWSGTPSFIEMRKSADGSFPRNPVNGVSNNNPFQVADRVKTPENVYRMLGSAVAVYNLLATQSQTLDFTMTGGVDSYNDVAKVISPADIWVEQVNANPGTISTTSASVVQVNLNATLAHNWIQRLYTATTSVGFAQSRRQSDITSAIGRGIFPGVQAVSSAVQTFVAEGQSVNKDISFFGQEEFLTLKERLLLTAGVNAERTSNNGDVNKYYMYPKFSASYRVPEFLRSIKELKVRLATGQAGNQPTQGKFTFLTTLYDEGVTGLRASTVKGYSSIQPETARELEGGLDLTMFDGRFRLSATQYRKAIDNLLLSASVAPSTGFSSQWINGGQIVNHGTEVELGITPIQRGAFEWISSTTFAAQKGRVTRLPVPAFIPTSGSFGSRYGNGFITVGQSPSVIQAVNDCRTGGLATGAPVVIAPRSAAAPYGGSCAAADRVLMFVGDANPDFTMGFSNELRWRDLRVATLLDWRHGGDVVNLTNNYFDAGLLGDTAVGNNRYAAYRAGKAVYVEDAGFVKLRELAVTYDLPAGLTSRLFNGKVQKATLEVTGRNLWTKTSYTGLSPEVSNFGNQATARIQDVTPYPPSRSWFLGVHTTF